MKNIIICLFLVSICVINLSAGEPDIDVKGFFRKNDADLNYNLLVNIKSNLPDTVKLRIEVNYARKYFVPASIRGNDKAEFKTEPILLDKTDGVITGGACKVKIGPYVREPYFGDYTIKVVFDPSNQPKGVKTKFGKSEKEVTFSHGNYDDLETQKKQVKAGVYKDLESLDGLYKNIKINVSEQENSGKFITAKWENIAEKITGIREKNKLRLEPRIYRIETVGKHGIDALCSELLKIFQSYFDKAKTETLLPGVTKYFSVEARSFDAMFEDYLNMLNLGIIINKTAVKSIIDNIEKHLGLLHGLYDGYEENPESAKKKWAEKSVQYQSTVRQELFRFANETSDYVFATYTVPFTQDFIKYIGECNKQINQAVNKESKQVINELQANLNKILSDIKESLELN